MINKIIEYLGTPDSGCWDVKATAGEISFRSVWGETMICFPEQTKEDIFQVQVIGNAGTKVLPKVLGEPELQVCVEEDGVETIHYWYLTRESKPTESTDVVKEFSEECEKRHIPNSVKSGYVAFYAGGKEIFKLKDGNALEPTVRFGIDASILFKELMDGYCKGETSFYLNGEGIICE